MGKETGIKWTDSYPEAFTALAFAPVSDAVGLVVPDHVACRAKRDTVFDVEAKFGVCGKRFDVVRFKIPTLGIAASRAGKLVASENRQAPIPIFRRSSRFLGTHGRSVFPSVVVNSSLHIGAVTQSLAHALTKFRRHLFALVGADLALVYGRYFGFRCRSVCPSLKGTTLTLSVDFHLYAIACKAISFLAVGPMFVIRKICNSLPRVAAPAAL